MDINWKNGCRTYEFYGSLTDSGKEAIMQSAGTSAKDQIQRAEVLNDKDKMFNMSRDMVKKMHDSKGMEAAIELAQSLSMDGNYKIDDKGNLSKEDFVPKHGLEMALKMGEGSGNRITEKMQGATFNGLTFNAFDGAVSAKQDTSLNIDEQKKHSSGSVSNFGTGLDIDAVLKTSKLKEGTEEFSNTKRKLEYAKALQREIGDNKLNTAAVLAAAHAGPEELNNYLNTFIKEGENGSLSPNTEGMIEQGKEFAAEYWEESLAAVALYEGGKIAYNKATNKFVDTESGKTVKPGDKVSYVDEKGFQKSRVVTADDLKSEARFREKLGPITDKLWSTGDKLSEFASSFNNPVNETADKSNDPDYDSTTDNSADKTKTFDGKKDSFHDGTPSDKINNSIVTDNEGNIVEKKQNSKEILKNAINNELAQLEKNPGSDADAYAQKKYALNSELKKIDDGGKIHTNNLKNLGINTKDLGFELGDKGFVDFEETDKKLKPWIK